MYWAAQHDPDGAYIKRWVPELRELSGGLAREPWRATSLAPTAAERDERTLPEQPPPVAKERDRIGWARRSFPAGGEDVEVWWACTRNPTAARTVPVLGVGSRKQLRNDPEDGKAYTLEQLRRKYQGQYAAKEVDKYWNAECTAVEEVRSAADSAVTAAGEAATGEVAGWPQGYPLPLLPPASFTCIEEIADYARRSQERKAAKSQRLRQDWASSKQSGQAAQAVGGAADKGTAAGGGKGGSAKGSAKGGGQRKGRWVRTEGA